MCAQEKCVVTHGKSEKVYVKPHFNLFTFIIVSMFMVVIGMATTRLAVESLGIFYFGFGIRRQYVTTMRLFSSYLCCFLHTILLNDAVFVEPFFCMCFVLLFVSVLSPTKRRVVTMYSYLIYLPWICDVTWDVCKSQFVGWTHAKKDYMRFSLTLICL